MQNIETFKCNAIPAPRTPSRSLILPATPLQEVPEYRAERLHRAQYDAALINYRAPQFRAAIVLVIMTWLILAIGCVALLIFLAAGGKL